ncbi:hypothetical protein VTN96DRAFT_8556 [Rasamsonia emersonii]|uniref:Glycoside hydrolase family 88 protein n=1 Tax=Rasamsonia emersonii (strain ATCC 16479 / CBS 393.64 / IMI 116815) TaxID=1408163 RepID=A0A0F4YPP2_RASE3|nr:Glycoside hydrolase family 88 protein [Rasamsonia emersonii CBS 393.64]KKA20204.1 Glycoside hydrolase family 88 protein [Rasamsonia emersonii CBS 393.64]
MGSIGETANSLSNGAGNGSLSPAAERENGIAKPGPRIDVQLRELYAESHAAKVWRVATEMLKEDPSLSRFPEYVPSTGDTAGRYATREAKFWTCGFFPGSLYTLLERCVRFPKSLPSPGIADRRALHDQLLQLCRSWSAPLHAMATRRDTHDLGFIIMPALRLDWELTGNRQSWESILTAAESLASRFDERVGAIRSWDQSFSKRYSITDKEENFLVIIDSMCNLDLLFYAGHHSANQRFIDIATKHAHTVLRSIVRKDWSTFHVCNFDPKTGAIQSQYTHQGYKDDSTWSRGQAWAILGFTQTYHWTKDPVFLQAATSLADHFLARLAKASHSHPYVPAWDFDDQTSTPPLRDTSAGMIAANGLVLLHQALAQNNTPSTYLDAAVRIARETIDLSLASDTANLAVEATNGTIHVVADEGEGESRWDSILKNATANNNEFAIMRYGDVGLVYADYYFLELGNKLLRMGLA